MEARRFDAIAARLGAAATRRGALMGALGALFSGATLAAATPVGASRKRRKGRGNAQGPCGDGSRKDNRCAKNGDCCTGFCQKNLTNKDRDGRCRCIRRGQPCKPSQTCCNSQCLKGVCGVGIATGKACAPDDSCAAPAATCRDYAEFVPAGTHCLLPNGEACAANNNCVSANCDAGVCKPQTCDVCASGCASDDLNQALTLAASGAVIRVDAGNWTLTGASGKITDGRTVTVRACNGVAGVNIASAEAYVFSVGEVSKGPISASGRWILEGLNLTNTSSNLYKQVVAVAMVAPDTGGLTVSRCRISAPTTAGAVLQGDTGDLLIEDSIIENMAVSHGVWSMLTGDPITATLSILRSTIRGASGIEAIKGTGFRLTLTDSSVTGNTNNGNGAIRLEQGSMNSTLLLDGTTTISGNTATGAGAAAMVLVPSASGSIVVTIDDTAAITGNTGVSDGVAVLVSETSGPASGVTMNGPDRIFGNTGGASCAVSPDPSAPFGTLTAKPGCTF